MFATGKLGVIAAVRQGPGKEFGGWSYRQGMAELLAQFWKKKKNAQVAFSPFLETKSNAKLQI